MIFTVIEMKKGKINLYIVDIVVALFTIFIAFMSNYKRIAYNINAMFWVALVIGFFIYYGFPKNKNYFKDVAIRYTIICCLGYVLVIYMLGLFVGFYRPIYSHTLINIIRNISIPLILLVSRELIRFGYCKKCGKDKLPIIIFTIFTSINIIVLNGFFFKFSDNEKIFLFVCLYVLPAFAQQFLYTYISYNVSYIPCLIIGFIIDILEYFVPIYPNLGEYLLSVFYLAFPFFCYIVLSKIFKYHDKKNIPIKRFAISVTTIPLIIFAGIVVILISGVFKYKMIAIASNSMNVTYYRGDAVIYEQTGIKNLKVGDIAVFYSDNKIVTHRVTKIYRENGKKFIITKGDNNENDDGSTEEKNIYGKVTGIVKYVGFPTLWFSEMFRK